MSSPSSSVRSKPRSKPRPAAERMERTSVDEHFTLSFDMVADLLGISRRGVGLLVQYSKLNAASGIPGPLTLTDNGHSVQLQSVLDYRRASARFPSL
ncbi:hypothetical protein [Streptomyces sp. NPDC054838]